MKIVKTSTGLFLDKKSHFYRLDTSINLTIGEGIVIKENGRRYYIEKIAGNTCNVKALSKKMIFAAFGIEYKSGRIFHSEFGFIPLLLVNGNEKIGIGCYHFSVLPGNFEYVQDINGKEYRVNGTCVCNCAGCYAQTGNYHYPSVKKSLFIKTWLINHDLDFVYRAISAQIIAENIEYLRIHAAGDFNNDMKYAFTWLKIAAENKKTIIWTYTKIKRFEGLFDGLDNANIVKSNIDGIGINYGHCGYIQKTYEKLIAAGKRVHICRCTYDKTQQCINCAGCSENEYVLFIEHSTEYVAAEDPDYAKLVNTIENQESTKREKRAAAVAAA